MPVLTPSEDVFAIIAAEADDSLLAPHQASTSAREAYRPTIGISANTDPKMGSCISRPYTDGVLRAGGIPILLPVSDDERVIDLYLDRCDGLLISGGDDLSPHYVGEDACQGLGGTDPERDRYDLLLIRRAAERNIPILGICRGHQLIAAAFGGTLYQDIYSQCLGTVLNHNPSISKSDYAHRISVCEANSTLAHLAKSVGIEDIWVNSLHHQAVDRLPDGFLATTVSADGINESMEAYPEKAILSVQWHPEQLLGRKRGDALSLALFKHLVGEASLYGRARIIHKHACVIDTHVDTPMHFCGDYDFRIRSHRRVDLPKMRDGLVDAVQMVAYLPQGKCDSHGHQAAFAYAIDRLESIRALVASAPEELCLAFTPEAIRMAKWRGQKAMIPAIENGYALGRDLSNLRIFRDLGVTYITLCHNGDNDLCDSARGSDGRNAGLSDLGREAVREMNRLGIMVDVSHAADSSIRDTLAVSTAPIVASHSSCRAICDHPRNLPDDLIVAIASKGGVVQVCMYKGFVHNDEEAASLSHLVDHIDHIVRLVGIDFVGIGSDFDGDGELVGCRAANDLVRITMELLRRGYNRIEIAKLWGENWLRVMQRVQNIGRNREIDDQ